jgi:hypothetical protein
MFIQRREETIARSLVVGMEEPTLSGRRLTVVIRPIKPGETGFDVAAPFAREVRGGAAIGLLDIIIVHAAVSLPNTSKRVLGSAAHQLTSV